MITPEVRSRLDALLAGPLIGAALAFLNQEGEETRLVGGAVRNAILDEATSDIDLATTMLPAETMRRAEKAGWKAVPTGFEHGTVTIIRAGQAFEVTTLREDIATDGRRAEVRFGRDFRHDAARRDFTVNALSLGQDGQVHDYFNGLADLAARRLRFIGDPDQRIREDYLRSLRFFRFSARYAEGLDEAGLAAVIRQRAGLSGLSRERIRQEMLKLLMAPRVVPVIAEAEKHGLLSEVLGLPVFQDRLAARLGFAQVARPEFQEQAEVPLLPRLAALLVEGEASVAHLRDSLRLTNAEEKWLSALIEARGMLRASGYQMAGFFTLGQDYPEVGPEVVRLAAMETANFGLLAHLPEVENPPVFHLTGKDVIALGIPAGRKVGLVLKAARTAWAGRGCPADVEAQRAILAEMLAAMG